MHTLSPRLLVLTAVVALTCACSDDEPSGGGGSGGTNAGGAPEGGAGEAGMDGTGGLGEGGEGGEGGAAGTSRRVFVTSATYTGDLGGLEGADANCQDLADAEGLGGTWLAWLSDTMGTTPETRFTQSMIPYVLVGGAQIAADWTDLTDNSIAAPIDRDETGASIDDVTVLVWTGTEADLDSVTPCCGDWASLDSGGGLGTPTATDATWSFIGGQPCTEVARLYCFEQ